MNNDREWHKIYRTRKEAEGEAIPPAPYPPNMEVNEQVNQSAKQYIQRPDLFRNISQLAIPALFLYGTQDIRPSWPVEQVAQLMPNADFILVDDAPHVLWLTQTETVQHHLRAFLAAHIAE